MGSRGSVKAWQRRSPLPLVAFAATVAVAPACKAAAPGYEVSVGIGESDNITLQPHGGQSDTIGVQGVDFTWHDRRPRLDADIDGAVDYLEYLRHTFSNEWLGNVIGDLHAKLVPDLLVWDVADNFGQGRLNAFNALTPVNRENINYFSTGPQLAIPLGGSDTLLDLNAHYARATYQVSPLDSNRESVGAAVVRKLSPQASVSLNFRDERVNYTNDVLNTDYKHQDAFARFDVQGRRTTIGIDVGFDRLQDQISPEKGVLARLQASRQLSAFSTVGLSFGHQYSDSADAFLIGQTLGGVNVNNTQAVQPQGTPFTLDSASLGWEFQRSRTGLGISINYYKEAYLQPSTQDDTRDLLEAHVSRQLTPTLRVALSEQFYYQKFKDLSASTTELYTDAHLTWRLSRYLNLTVDFNHSSRHSDFASSDYTENRLFLLLGYGRPAEVPPGPPMPRLPRQSPY